MVDIEKELYKAKERNAEIDLFIKRLFEQNANGIIPMSTFSMMMEKYNKEKNAIEHQIKNLERRQKEEILNPQKEIFARNIVALFKTLDGDSLMRGRVIQKLIKKLTVRTRYVNNCVKKRKIELIVEYFYCDEMIKGFVDCER